MNQMLKFIESTTAKASAQTDLQRNTQSTKLDVLIRMHFKRICLSSVITMYVKWT